MAYGLNQYLGMIHFKLYHENKKCTMHQSY